MAQLQPTDRQTTKQPLQQAGHGVTFARVSIRATTSRLVNRAAMADELASNPIITLIPRASVLAAVSPKTNPCRPPVKPIDCPLPCRVRPKAPATSSPARPMATEAPRAGAISGPALLGAV